jgi:hypothetical protein
MPFRRAAFFLVLLCSSLCFAQFRTGAAKAQPPLITVREFCRLDFLGGRLSPEGWAKMKDLTMWKDNPSWKTFRVASRYEQTDSSSGFRSAKFAVQYQVLGRFELGIGFTSDPEPQLVEFKLKETEDGWRIESTDPETLEPYVSKARAIQWLHDRLKTSTDAGDKISIEAALKELQPSAPKP